MNTKNTELNFKDRVKYYNTNMTFCYANFSLYNNHIVDVVDDNVYGQQVLANDLLYY